MDNFSTTQPCICCQRNTFGGNCFHHLYTRKARADLTHKSWNMIPVCQEHHNHFHNKGTMTMSQLWPSVRFWLESQGWEIELGKWRHPDSYLKA